MFYLVVVRPFAAYRIGDIVAESHAMDKILTSEHAECIVRVSSPGEG